MNIVGSSLAEVHRISPEWVMGGLILQWVANGDMDGHNNSRQKLAICRAKDKETKK
jgi:hypothetical protein